MFKNQELALIIFVLFALLVQGCGSGENLEQKPEPYPDQEAEPEKDAGPEQESEPEPDQDLEIIEQPDLPESPESDQSDAPGQKLPLWRTGTLEDVSTGDKFSINDFSDPVLVETFAVWCPICTRQQEEVKKLHETRKDIVSIAINTDPNEEKDIVKSHVSKNGFDWRYAVASKEFTRSLIEEFGAGIVSAPSAPVFLVCPDGKAHTLRTGVKPASELGEKTDELCKIK